MRRVSGLAVLLIFLSAPTYAAASRYGDDGPSIRTVLRWLVKALEDARPLLPGG